MNKLIVVFLVFLFLCVNTPVGQLLKVPNLINHYLEHKIDKNSSTISFISFIKLHYSENSNHHQEEHHDLPFKTLDNSNHFVFTIFNIVDQIQFISFSLLGVKSFYYNNTFSSNLITSIWLPPKIA